MKDDMLEKICKEVEAEYGMSGLSAGLYGEYAQRVAEKYAEKRVEETLRALFSGSTVELDGKFYNINHTDSYHWILSEEEK